MSFRWICMKKAKELPLDDEGQPSKNTLSLSSFAGYCLKHPEQRFFQALRNWFGVGYIGTSNDLEEWHDTFYLEEDKDYKIND